MTRSCDGFVLSPSAHSQPPQTVMLVISVSSLADYFSCFELGTQESDWHLEVG